MHRQALEFGGHLRDGLCDCPFDLGRDVVRVLERQVLRQLEVQRDLEPVVDRDHADVVELAHAWHGERRGVDPLAEGRVLHVRLDVDDDVALGQGALHRGFDRVRSRVTLPHAGVRGDADDDVGEVAARGLPHAEPPKLDTRLQMLDRLACRALGVDRDAVHEHVHVPPHQPRRGNEDEHGDEERGERVALAPARTREQEPAQDGRRPHQVAAEVKRVRCERRAAVPARGAQRDDHPARVDRDHDQHDEDRVPDRVHARLGGADEDGQRAVRDVQAGEDEDPRLGQRGEVLRLPVPVRVPAIGRPPGDPDREQRQQRRHEVGAGVHRFGDEPEAPARETGGELQRDEHAGGDHRDEGGAPLRAHPAKATEAGLRLL